MAVIFAPSERGMWLNDPAVRPKAADDNTVTERYIRGEGRIVTETNREKLPGFVKALENSDYMDLRPFYQRRPRWDDEKQSRLIESFIMNIPVPPVFLYERAYNSYEVMDGQQRITALRDFYQNRFALAKLRAWPELNGRKYHSLPKTIKDGLDRRSISSIVVLKESTGDEDDAAFLRETVFERLNTGGVKLSPQEIRNALYQSPFNSLLWELSRYDQFRDIWGIPRYVENEIEENPVVLENSIFSKMEDLEIILRFYALRHASHYRSGMRGFLDIFMRRAVSFTEEDVSVLREAFLQTLGAAVNIFGDKVFRPYDAETEQWEGKPHRAFYDAVMVGISAHIGHRQRIEDMSQHIIEGTKDLFREHEKGTFTGRKNTREDVENRIRLFSNMVSRVIDA